MRCSSFTTSSVYCLFLLLHTYASVGLSMPFTTRDDGDDGGSTYQNGVYFTNWNNNGDFGPGNLPAESINHIFYAFLDVAADGTVTPGNVTADLAQTFPGDDPSESGTNVYGAVKQLGLLKRKHRHIKTLLSIGGNHGRSSNFSEASSTPENRARFALSSLSLLKDWGFDGIDVDWEYPETEDDAKNYIKLFQTLRAVLDSYSHGAAGDYHFLLSSTTSVASSYTDLVDLEALGQSLDWINLMCYDYSGDWTKTTAHQANLFSGNGTKTTYAQTKGAMDRYVEGGAPPEKILMGLPLYSRQFVGTAGLGEKYDGGNGDGSGGKGSWLYKDLPREGADEVYDDKAGASYSWDTNTGTLNSYDTVEAVEQKVKYLQDAGMGGAFFWEASGDKEGEGSLMDASFKALGGLDMTENLIDFRDSVYDNVKAGFS